MRRSVPMWPPLAVVAGAALAGWLLGLSLGSAVLLGLIGGGVTAAVMLSRRPVPDRVEPTRVGEPWRQRVAAALAARNRFERALGTTSAGPLKERLEGISAHLDEAVQECWAVARRGHRLDRAVGELGIPRLRSQLDALEKASLAAGGGDPERATIGESVKAQLESAERLIAVSNQTHDRLRLLTTQMDEAVARAIELAATAPDIAALQPVDSDIDGLIIEFQALQAALEETGRA